MGGKLSSKRVSLKSSEPWDLKNLWASRRTFLLHLVYIVASPILSKGTWVCLIEDVEKVISHERCKHRDDPKTYNEAMWDIDSKKGCVIAFLSRDLFKIFICNSLWISLLVIENHKVYNNLGVGTFIWSNCLIEKEKLWISKGSVGVSNTDIS